MRHDWIFDVLADLRSYAEKNGLTGLAAQVEVTLRVARAELEVGVIAGDDDDPDDGLPPAGRPH